MENKNLRVILITMGVSRIVKPIVNNFNVVGIIECSRGDVNKKSYLYKIIIFFYSFIFQKKNSLKYFCKNNKSIDFYKMNNGSDKLLENWVKSKRPDVIVVYSMNQLLKENIFLLPKFGTINLHTSFLPKYRGPNPEFWQYYNLDLNGGVTLHFIDKGEDTGDIIFQEKYKIPLGMKSSEMLNVAVSDLGVKLIFKALTNINNLTRIPQSKISSTDKARNISKIEHSKVIDWENWKIERIWHLLRGTEQWLDAIEPPPNKYRCSRWIIEEFKHCDTEEFCISKVYREKNRYFLICKDGKIYMSVKFNVKKFVLSLIS